MKFDENLPIITIGLLLLLSAVVVFNSIQLSSLRTLELAASPVGSTGHAATGVAQGVNLAVIPSGEPRVYGAELGVSYSDVSATDPARADVTIRKLAVLDQQIRLSGDQLARYISIAKLISCEYCCGAPSIIDEQGEAACGCAHSYAMRGVAKYLIKNHGNEFSDAEILEEMGKWKALFFPGQISKKAEVLASNGIATNYVNLASNKYRGAESQAASSSGAGSAMVGGC